jgi:hydroxypyruvate reductase
VRDLLRRAFAETLQDLDVRGWMRAHVEATNLRAHAAQHPLLVIAIGKAARPMADGLVELLPGARLRGLVVPPGPDDGPLPPFEVIAGGHPLPTTGSVAAATRALELARSARPEELVVFLVSGGGSAMFELPADPAVTLEELRTLYRALGGSGAPITAVNTVRRHLSAVKGGRLALAAAGAHRLVTMAISDVPHVTWDQDCCSALASGPTVPDDSTLEDCRAVLDHFALWSAVPAPLRIRLANGDLPPPLRLPDELLQRAVICLLLSERNARALMMRRLRTAGILAVEDTRTDDMPHRAAAAMLLRRLDRLRRRHPGRRVAVATSGELSVPLPDDPGTGGRNQQFALHCARLIRGRPITVLSCGTDGVDGNSPAAGAVVDGTTTARAKALGFDVRDTLARCDAFPLLQALGDTVITGPTGTNVRDLRVLVHG